MKKGLFLFSFIFIAAFLIFIVGYAVEEGNKVSNRGEKMEYEVIEELSGDLKKSVGFIKNLRGFGVIKKVDNEAVIYIGSGEKPTGGYGISVDSVKKVDNITKIEVVETAPEPDKMVTQALTYPYVVIKVLDVTENIEVINEQGEIFEDINDETKEVEHYENND